MGWSEGRRDRERIETGEKARQKGVKWSKGSHRTELLEPGREDEIPPAYRMF